MAGNSDDRDGDATISIRLPWLLLGVVGGGSGAFGFGVGDYQATASPQCNAIEVHAIRDEIDYSTRHWSERFQQINSRLDKLEAAE